MIELPEWARASESRREHIARVVALLNEWAIALDLSRAERENWRHAGTLHDALRDASECELRTLVPDRDLPSPMLHGPAVAAVLESEGETRDDVLLAIRWHTTGCARWAPTGQALYMADYLEPGRAFARADRAFLAAMVPRDFNGAFRQVIRHRLERSLREGNRLYPATVEMWNAVR